MSDCHLSECHAICLNIPGKINCPADKSCSPSPRCYPLLPEPGATPEGLERGFPRCCRPPGMFLGCFLVPSCSDTCRGCTSLLAQWDGAPLCPSPDTAQCHRGLSACTEVMVGLRNPYQGGHFGGLRLVGRGLGAPGDPSKLFPLLRAL